MKSTPGLFDHDLRVICAFHPFGSHSKNGVTMKAETS